MRLKVDNGAAMIPNRERLQQYGITIDFATKPTHWPDWHDIMVLPDSFKIEEDSEHEIIFRIGEFNAFYSKSELTFDIADEIHWL
tara:strand:+ start:15429 stop:15683 length:255 start_codon:yes stop_codon:yes gene_type:complete